MTERLEPQDPDFEILFTQEDIQKKVFELSEQISLDYSCDTETPLVLYGVLKGATPFLVDLSRTIEHPNLFIDYIGVSSYGDGMKSSKKPIITLENKILATDKNVLIVEDIIDTGFSIHELLGYLKKQNPKSLNVCAFLSKPDRREIDVPISYLGFTIDDLWVQGYGLDTKEKGRNWPFIAVRKQ